MQRILLKLLVKLENMKNNILLKTFLWRIIGSSFTFLISFYVTNEIRLSLMATIVEMVTKTIFYYYHEILWLKVSLNNTKKFYLYKTLSWRILAILDTFLIILLLTENVKLSLSFVIIDIILKSLLYYLHELLWAKILKNG